MASLGIRKFKDLVGRTDLLRASEKRSAKASTLEFSLVLKNSQELLSNTKMEQINHSNDNFAITLGDRLDNSLIDSAKSIFDDINTNINVRYLINNTDRAFGSTLSWHIAR